MIGGIGPSRIFDEAGQCWLQQLVSDAPERAWDTSTSTRKQGHLTRRIMRLPWLRRKAISFLARWTGNSDGWLNMRPAPEAGSTIKRIGTGHEDEGSRPIGKQ